MRDYQTVSGAAGKGGALDAGGPVIAGGTLFVGSGYGQWSGMPRNVLLAFAAEQFLLSAADFQIPITLSVQVLRGTARRILDELSAMRK